MEYQTSTSVKELSLTNFRVGITHDFLGPDGSPVFGEIGLDLLDAEPGIEREFLGPHGPVLTASDLAGYDALLQLGGQLPAEAIEGADRLVLTARFGVGLDNVDVGACTRHGVLVTVTPEGVRRPMAVAALTLVLALSQRLVVKDRLVREGRWAERGAHVGTGLQGRTLGILGLGNIGAELARLAAPFGLRLLAHSRHAAPADAARLGVELASLETVLRESDFLCVTVALRPETRHLLDAERLALIKPGAFLVNVARGPIVDQAALVEALREGRLAGAGLDVLEQEPPDPHDPLLALENVVLAPHSLGWTDEGFRGMGRSACRDIVAVARGETPANVVNPEALDHPRWHRQRAEKELPGGATRLPA